MRFVAYTIKGLEYVVESELSEVLGVVKIVQKEDKVIIFDYDGSLELLTQLRTADDLGVFVSDLETITPANIVAGIEHIKRFRPINNIFSITSSIVSRELNKDELLKDISEKISNLGLEFADVDRSNLDFRIFLNLNIGFMAIRLTAEPLNKRKYEVGTYMGALKPTIAAAMVRLATAQLPSDAKIVDNFCGSGTLLCEAFIESFSVYGGDLNPEAVSLTRQRLQILGCTTGNNLKTQDATKTKWNSAFFDCAISNLPWDKQHEISNITELYVGCVKEYKRILKKEFTLCIICHKPELLIKHIKKEFGEIDIKRLDIGYLGQTPSIILVSSVSHI